MKRSSLLIALGFTAVACTGLRADESWDGGSGIWDFNNTPDWNGSSTWTPNDQVANFYSTPGTVTVDNSYGAVGDQFLSFGTSTAANPWTITGGDLAVSGNNNTLVDSEGAAGSVVIIDSNMNVDTTRATDRNNVFDRNGSTVTLNGNITFGSQTTSAANGRALIIGSTDNNSVFNLNGTFSDSNATGGVAYGLRLAEGGATEDTYFINGNISGLHGGLQIGSGNVVVGPTAVLNNSSQTFMYEDQGYNTENVALLAQQGATIANGQYISMKYDFDSNGNENPGNGTLGGYDASSVTFSGGIGLDNSGAILTAAADGRATFSGNIYGHSPNGLYKTGAGVVVISNSNGYGLNNDFTQTTTTSTTAMDIQQGTLLITNPAGTGSAFGNNSGMVKIEAGATLGGSGATGSSQQTVAMASNSVISPGDAGQSNLGINPSISTLTLAGGLSAINGLTMNFKLNGINNDAINFANSVMTLNGVVTIDLSGTPTPDMGSGNYGVFMLLDNIGTGSTSHGLNVDTLANTISTDPAIIVNAPSGYAVESSGFAPNPNSAGSFYYVQLEATPEPSTYGLMGLGLLALVAIRRFRRLAV